MDPNATRSLPPADETRDPLEIGLAAAFGSPRELPPTAPIFETFGTLIDGRYKLIQPIGEGGMGSVWLAEQTEPVKRRVAVKLIKAGMDSKQVLARFEAERQALALMDHPNIAKVLDGGLHENRPFFVMELVKGVPITEYCDLHKLTPKQRLELFVPVCQAIQHAHQKGVIHRDIKPSNVLIALYDDRPVPKVIDFGVAKATGGTLTEATIETGFGGIVGTPQYMSPEQATFNNLDIDTRSDVYALGVLLYELLTGSPPFSGEELKKKGLMEILRVVREEEPPRPSTKLSTADTLPTLSANRGTEPKKLTGLLRNELDWIVMKALEKDRTRRYETANGFAADINRYLAGEPVIAHPPSTGYRLKKFVKRNRGQVIAASSVFFALMIGIVGTTWGLLVADQRRRDAEKSKDEETEQRKIAIAAKERAEQAELATAEDLEASTNDAITKLIGSRREIGPNERAFLEGLAKRWEAFASRQANVMENLHVKVKGYMMVGNLWSNLGRPRDALSAYQTMVANIDEMIGKNTNPEARDPLLGGRSSMRLLEVNELYVLGEYERADIAARKAVQDHREMSSQWASAALMQLNLANCHELLCRIRGKLGDASGAEHHALERVAVLEQMTANIDTNDRLFVSDQLSSAFKELAVALANNGKHQLAEAYRQKALQYTTARVQHKDGFSHWSELIHLTHIGKQGEAGRLQTRNIQVVEREALEAPANLMRQVDLGGAYCDMGSIQRNAGAFADSLDWYRKSIDTLSRVIERDTSIASASGFLRNAYWGRGLVYVHLGKWDEAIGDLERAIDFHRRTNGIRDDPVGMWVALGEAYLRKQRFPDADQRFQESLAATQRICETKPDDAVAAYNLGSLCVQIAGIYRESGRSADALRWSTLAFDQLWTIRMKHPGNELERRLGFAHFVRAQSYVLANRFEESLVDFRKSLEFKPAPEAVQDRREMVPRLFQYAEALEQLGKTQEAETVLDESVRIREALAKEHPDVRVDAHALCLVYFDRGWHDQKHKRYGPAITWFDRAANELDKCALRWPGEEWNLKRRWCRQHRGELFRSMGKYADAAREYGLALSFIHDPEHTIVDLFRSQCLVLSGDVEKGLHNANSHASKPDPTANILYQCCCVYALAIAKQPDKSAVYSEQSMALLIRAIHAGFKNVSQLKADTDLDALREHADFRMLIGELEKKTDKK